MRLLLGPEYYSYTEACGKYQAEKLVNRRLKLCSKFAVKEVKKPNSIFTKYTKSNPRYTVTRHVVEPFARTRRYFGSSIPYLARIINSMPKIT